MTAMYKALLLIVALVLLVACSTGSKPPSTANPGPSNAAPAPAPTPAAMSTSTGEVQPKLQELAGNDATNSGNVNALAGEEVSTASDCAMNAAKAKKAFLVSYEMPGLSVGVAGNAEGNLFAVQTADENGKTVAKSQPCPAQLRLAQSGRVTCMPAGSMGLAPGSGNPHGGGMTTTPGAANPHASAPTKSH